MSAKPLQPLKEDLRRMVPVLTLVLITAIGVVVSMQSVGRAHLNAVVAGNPNACSYADLYITRGYRKIPEIRDVLYDRRMATQRIQESALGIGKDNPELTEARENFLRALELCPSNPFPHYALSVLEWYAGNEAAAYTQLGRYYFLNREFPSALAQYEIALSKQPDFAPAILAKAIYLRSSGQLQEALDLIRDDEERLLTSLEGQFIIGQIYSDTAELEKSRRLLENALRKQPGYSFAMYDLLRVYRELGTLEEGAEFFMSLEKQETPLPHSVYTVAASLYRDAKLHQLEERALLKALRLFPNNVQTNFDLAICYHMQGERYKARDSLRTALEYNATMTRRLLAELDFEPGEALTSGDS